MYHIKNDQRSIRSGQLLYEALATLMQEKPFHSITVTDLVKTAQVGRTTYYRNFDEMEDILWLRCDQTFDAFLAYVKTYMQQQPTESRTALLKPLLRFFYQNSEIIELLIRANRLDIIQGSFWARLQPFREQIAVLHGVAEIYADYSLAIRIGVMTNILVHWTKTGKQQAPDQLAETLEVMMNQMITLEQMF